MLAIARFLNMGSMLQTGPDEVQDTLQFVRFSRQGIGWLIYP